MAHRYTSYAASKLASSSAASAGEPTGPESAVSRVWREQISPPLRSASAAVARPLAPLASIGASLGATTMLVGGRALVATADTAVVARGLMYTSVRQASADIARAVVGDGAGAVVAEGLDTLVAAQATVASVTCHGVGLLLQAGTTAALANNLLYVGIKRGSSEAVARRFGPAAAMVTPEVLDSLNRNGLSGAASVPLSSVGWALSQ